MKHEPEFCSPHFFAPSSLPLLSFAWLHGHFFVTKPIWVGRTKEREREAGMEKETRRKRERESRKKGFQAKGKNVQYWPEVKRTMAFKHEYSATSTWSDFNFSTCSWKIRMWSMNATTRSAAMGEAWRPAAARRGATWSGIEHWDALRTNNSDQTSLRSATWSVTWRSGKKGMLRAHSTAEKRSRAANSQMESIPMIPELDGIHCDNLDGWYGSARRSNDMKLDRYEWPFKLSAAPAANAADVSWPDSSCWDGGTRPLWTAVFSVWKRDNKEQDFLLDYFCEFSDSNFCRTEREKRKRQAREENAVTREKDLGERERERGRGGLMNSSSQSKSEESTNLWIKLNYQFMPLLVYLQNLNSKKEIEKEREREKEGEMRDENRDETQNSYN